MFFHRLTHYIIVRLSQVLQLWTPHMPLYGKAPNSLSDVKEYRIPGLSFDLINSHIKINPQTSVKTAGKKGS